MNPAETGPASFSGQALNFFLRKAGECVMIEVTGKSFPVIPEKTGRRRSTGERNGGILSWLR